MKRKKFQRQRFNSVLELNSSERIDFLKIFPLSVMLPHRFVARLNLTGNVSGTTQNKKVQVS